MKNGAIFIFLIVSTLVSGLVYPLDVKIVYPKNALDIAMPQNPGLSKNKMLKKINLIRRQGCFCGSTYMRPTGPLRWNDTLYKSAMDHAKEMTRYKYFSHISHTGKDVGDRLLSHGYNWLVAGENLGEGQETFDEVMNDWLKSESHCKMLMNPKVDEVGMAHHGRYWVQHFGKRIPKGYVRK